MNFKQIIQDYFTFSRNERKGITILLVLIFILAVANKVIFYFETPAKIDTVLLDSISHNQSSLNDSITRLSHRKKFFSFNPNTIDSISLDSLGLPESVKQNLLKFRNNGGKFYSDNDFRKIYGVTDAIYAQVRPFLRFENEPKLPGKSSEKAEPFKFDPNKATDDEFLRLGLTDKQIKTIRNYQEKGGLYYNKQDFFRMWGLTEVQKKALSDFVVIEKTDNSRSEIKSLGQNVLIELNSTDSVQLKLLPGIGDKLSKRIVKYRDLLGGFCSISQLNEVYGLKEETIQKIKDKVTIDISKIRKLDINFANVNELSKHPYLKKDLALRIVKFRTKYGSIHDLAVLRDSMILNMDDYNRLVPYF